MPAPLTAIPFDLNVNQAQDTLEYKYLLIYKYIPDYNKSGNNMTNRSRIVDPELTDAAKRGDTAAAAKLLDAGANPNAVDDHYRTPLRRVL